MHNNPVKLISLNAGGHQYFDLIVPFLKKQSPDVVCLQEIYKIDAEKITTELSANIAFTPLRLRQLNDNDGEFVEWGNATVSKLPILEVWNFFYEGKDNSRLDKFADGNIKHNKRSLLITKIQRGESDFNIAHTHFVGWKPGTDRVKQLHHFEKLFNFLNEQNDLILCGDLNIQRGDELYDQLSSIFKDNIPKNVESTLDPVLHPYKDLKIVIDYLFTTSQYEVTKTKLHEGVSDHKAIVAHIVKNGN